MLGKDISCPYFKNGQCKFGNRCRFFHPPRVCTHIEYGYCQICHPPSKLCKLYEQGLCNYGNECKYSHSRRDVEIRRSKQKYFDFTILPPDLLKIIFIDLYLSNLISINQQLYKFITDYFPLKIFIFKNIYSKLSTAISINRKQNDAIFQLCLRIFNYDKIEPKCVFIEAPIGDYQIFSIEQIFQLEWKDEEFYLFRKQLINHRFYKNIKQQDNLNPLIIDNANLFLKLNSLEPVILPFHQGLSFYY